MDQNRFKILIADDHVVVRNGIIKSLITSFPDAGFGEAGNAADVMRLVYENSWDLIILDINMPGRSGMDVLKEIKEHFPKTPVIIFSMYPEDQFAVRSFKAGASAYLTKDISSQELEKAILKVLRGERYLSPTVAELITNEMVDGNNKPAHERLSDREHQVFLLIGSGKNVTDIARELNLSL